jgi:hypothetical protein
VPFAAYNWEPLWVDEVIDVACFIIEDIWKIFLEFCGAIPSSFLPFQLARNIPIKNQQTEEDEGHPHAYDKDEWLLTRIDA